MTQTNMVKFVSDLKKEERLKALFAEQAKSEADKKYLAEKAERTRIEEVFKKGVSEKRQEVYDSIMSIDNSGLDKRKRIVYSFIRWVEGNDPDRQKGKRSGRLRSCYSVVNQNILRDRDLLNKVLFTIVGGTPEKVTPRYIKHYNLCPTESKKFVKEINEVLEELRSL